MKFRKSAALVLCLSTLAPIPAWAMGKKKAPSSTTPAYTTPQPVRKVILKPVSTKPFQLPNGSTVDLNADLNSMLETAVASTQAFSPTDPAAPGSATDPCDTHLEIRAAVTTLELDIAELGLTVGYSPSGSDSTITSLTGSADVKIGTVAMDFSVWECQQGQCSAVAATTATHLTAGVNLALQIDFSVIKTGPNLVYNTPLGNALRAIMNDGMKKLASSARLGELSWQATVREAMPEAGTLWFDAGTQSRLAPNQSFVIYEVTPSTGVCQVYKPVAYVHSTQVDEVSSAALVDQLLDPRGIHEGDLVMIKAAN